MKLRILVALAIFFSCAVGHAFADTVIDSNITQDTEWTLEGSPYSISTSRSFDYRHPFTVAAGATLTIDLGVEVKLGLFTSLIVEGSLVAKGTADTPILFSRFPDAYLVRNDRIAPPGIPDKRQKLALIYVAPDAEISNQGGIVTIDSATFQNVGYSQSSGSGSLTHVQLTAPRIGVTLTNGQLTVRDSRITGNIQAGINHPWQGDLTVEHSEIDHNGIGIDTGDTGSVRISESSIHDNGIGVSNPTETPLSFAHVWWGSESGPRDANNPDGTGDAVSGVVDYTPWLTRDPFSADPCAAPGACASNVLFLPGIEGSRLYEGTGCGAKEEEKLWEPIPSTGGFFVWDGDRKVRELKLDAQGKSSCSDIYTKEGDIIDTAGGGRIYQAFIDQMNSLKQDGTINDWEPVAYDWRLSLPDLLHNGVERDGKIYYEEASSTPYIEQELRRLAASSKSGKVTIVAHSNGGLVAKALLQNLGSDSLGLVDKLILVGSPQSGTPLGAGVLLFGTDQAIKRYGNFILHADVAREFAQNSPMAYHLLPSESYFESAAVDTNHPVIKFEGANYIKEENAYGPSITNQQFFAEFITAKEGGREKPKSRDVNSAEVLNPSLVDYAEQEHSLIDKWTPPSGIETDQIAGWGIDTIAGIDFYSPRHSLSRLFRPIFTEDGDGTVTTPSAIMMASSTEVKRYWVNLDKYNRENSRGVTHKDLFEIPQLEEFIQSKIKNNTSDLPLYIQASQPAPITSSKKLIFYLHSPLSLELKDSTGNVTGLAPSGEVSETIPGSSYGELGEVKYVVVPEGDQYQLSMHGLDSGTFSLEIAESVGGAITMSNTISDVPTTANTLASLSIANGLDTSSALTVDLNGDGKDVLTIQPKVGDEVQYSSPVPVAPAPLLVTSSGGAGAISIPVVAPQATTTQAVVTLAPAASMNIATTSPKRVVAIVPKKKTQKQVVAVATSSPSAQPQPKAATAAVYNGWYGFWQMLKSLF